MNELAQRFCASSIGADQIILLDENVLQISAGSAHFAAGRLGPAFTSYLRSLGATSLTIAERGSEHAGSPAGLLDYVVRDDLAGLKLRLNGATFHNRVDLSSQSKTRPRDRVVVFSGHQPGYFRSLGFFAKLALSDFFCMADDLQFVRCEWQNRQRFPRPGNSGMLWLTVPLLSGAGFESIRCKRIANQNRAHDWRFKHWRTIESVYASSPYFDRYGPFVREIYRKDWQTLGALCEAITRFCALELGIKTPTLLNSIQVGFPVGLRKGQRIAAEIEASRRQWPHCSQERAVYLSGAGASYLNLNRRASSGVIERHFLERDGVEIRSCVVDSTAVVRETGLDPRLPAVAFLFHLGPDAARLLREATYVGEPIPV